MNKKILAIAILFAIVVGAVGTLYAQDRNVGVRVNQLQMGQYRPLGAFGSEAILFQAGRDAWSGTLVYTDSDGTRHNGTWRADGSGADFIISVPNIRILRARTTGTRSFTTDNGIEWVRI
jgi:hypothetical protein